MKGSTPNRNARSARSARLWRWLGRHRVLVAVVAALVVWIGIAAVLVLQARQHLDRAVARLDTAELRLEPSQVVDGGSDDALAAARRDFHAAATRMSSVFVAPLRVLPVVGRQVDAVRSMSRGADRTLTVAQRTRQELRHVLDGGWDASDRRVESLRQVAHVAGRALGDLADVDLGPRNALLGPIADAQQRFRHRLHEARVVLGDAKSIAGAMAQLLQGPSRYLVLAANNAEMRAGSGMFLSAGSLAVQDGKFGELAMQSTGELLLPAGAVPVSGDLADRWGWLLPNEDWRNLGASPNFASTAALASEMWRARTGETVDGVLALDPVALRALLAATGPVTVDGVQLDADNVLQYVFHDQYEGLDGNGANEARRDRLGQIAGAALEQLDAGTWDVATLLDQLRGAVDGRHLLAWSPHATQQRAWRAAGVSGALRSDSLMVSAMNFGGSKVDQYLAIGADLQVQPGAGGTDVRLTLTLKNNAPLDDPGYILGPYDGAYPGILAVDVPAAARDPKLQGVDHLVAGGPDGAATVLAGPIDVPPGSQQTYVVTFSLPPGMSAIHVAPSARHPGIDWTYGGVAWPSGPGRRITW
jgi:hypothetical protein